MRSVLASSIRAIQSYDELERQHIAATLDWIASGAPRFRIARPNRGPQHLVSYLAPVDDAARKVPLVDHRNNVLWLPTGGHIEPDDAPIATVERAVALA